jgi:uncharacterized protein YifE (UPF0438 family)
MGKKYLLLAACIAFMAVAGVSCDQDNLQLSSLQQSTDTIPVIGEIVAVTDLSHKWDTLTDRSNPTDTMTAEIIISNKQEVLLTKTVNPTFAAKGLLSKKNYAITKEQLDIKPTSARVRRHVIDNGGDQRVEKDTVFFNFVDGQEFSIPVEITKPLVTVGSRDFEFGTVTLTGAEFVSLTNQELGTKADVLTTNYNTTYKAMLEVTELNVVNPQTFNVPVEVSTGRHIITNNDVVKVYADNKVRQGLTTTTERCAFDLITVYLNGDTITETKEIILNHLFKGINPYDKDVTSFGYSFKSTNGIAEGAEAQNRNDGKWTVWQRTDSYSSDLSNGVAGEKVVTDYSLMHERTTYKDGDIEVVFGYADIDINEVSTTSTEVATDKEGKRKAELVNKIATEYLTIEQPLDEMVNLYMPDKGVKERQIKNAVLTVYRDSVVATLDFVTVFNDGTSEVIKEHISKPRNLAVLSDWSSVQNKAEEKTAKVVSIDIKSENKQEGNYWRYVNQVRSLSNVTTLADSTTKTNAWISEDPNLFVYEREGAKKEFDEIIFAAEQVSDTLVANGSEGAYKLFNFTDKIQVTFGTDKQETTAPGLIKLLPVADSYKVKNAKQTITDTEVISELTFVTYLTDGDSIEENYESKFPRKFETLSNWSSDEDDNSQATDTAKVVLTSSTKVTKDEFTAYNEVRDITTAVTLSKNKKTNQWRSTDPNRVAFSKNGINYDFGTIDFSATEMGQNVSLKGETSVLAVYDYTDNIKVVYGGNSIDATAPGMINVTKPVVITSKETSNEKLTVYQDKVTASLTYTINYSDGNSTSENISKDFPRSFKTLSNWTANEDNDNQATGAATVTLTGSQNMPADDDFSYVKETRKITTVATLNSSTEKNNEWESIDPNKIVFTRDGVSHDFGEIAFSATETGASTALASKTVILAVYDYTDGISVSYGGNTFNATAPGKINVAITVTGRYTSNEKLTVYQDKVNASLTFTTEYSDGSSKSEDISKDFPRSFKTLTNWTAEEKNANQSTSTASVSLSGSQNMPADDDFSYVKETRKITTVATLNSSAKKNNEWESVEPNKIKFSRDGVDYDFGEIAFAATEAGANVNKTSNDVYGYTDKINVTYGDNSFSASAPGTINIWVPDFPEEYGKFVKAVVTTTRDETRKTWMYVVSVQFEKKTLPIFIHRGDTKPSYDLKYAVAANSKYNSASYIKSQKTWLNTIASDGAECLDWVTIDGKNADNIPYSTADAWGWDNGHSTVHTKTFSAKVEGSVLTIKKGNSVFATYKSVK